MQSQVEEREAGTALRHALPWAGWVAGVLFVLCLPVFLVITNLRAVTDSSWLYEYGFSTYDIRAVTGITQQELLSVARQTRDYFNNDIERLDVAASRNGEPFTLYNEREIQHMADVKGLLRLAARVQETTGAYVVLYLVVGLLVRRKAAVQDWQEVVFQGGLFTLGLMALAGLGSLMDFDRLFLVFHIVSFSNDLWMLDPSRDYLLKMYPEGFFRDATIAIAGLTLSEALLLVLVSHFVLLRFLASNEPEPATVDVPGPDAFEMFSQETLGSSWWAALDDEVRNEPKDTDLNSRQQDDDGRAGDVEIEDHDVPRQLEPSDEEERKAERAKEL